MATNHAPLRTLPDDVLQRVLVGIPLDDHRATASVSRAFHAVVCGPRFLALRRQYGFAERGIVVVKNSKDYDHISVVDADISTSISEHNYFSHNDSTTDGTRLLVSIVRNAVPPHVLAVDVSSREWNWSPFGTFGTSRQCKWSPFATLPLNPLRQYYHCIEWHNGRLYIAGGRTAASHMSNDGEVLNSLHAFNEATGLWEELPSMLHGCWAGVSGVIGNRLFIGGGIDVADLSTLQVYDIATRTWRLGAPLPHFGSHAVVTDGKLFVFAKNGPSVMVYDPPSNTWTVEPNYHVEHACVHNDRIVVFSYDGTAYERATDGSWHPYEVAEPGKARHGRASESVILG